jgi:hypothetical protein
VASPDPPAAEEPLAPDAPIPSSPPPPSPRPPLPRRPFVRTPPRVPLPSQDRAAQGLGAKQWLGLGAVVLLLVHLAFGRAEFALPVRFLVATPGLLLIWEIYRYLDQDVKRELPFNALGLLYFYIAFSFPALFELQFFDLGGPVTFTDQARFSGGAAVAVGSLFMYGGIRAGETLGMNLRPGMISLSPPRALPPAFGRALTWYGALTAFVAVIYVSAPSLIPGTLAMVLTVTICFELALGMAMAHSELLTGPWSRHFTLGLLAAGWAGGLIRGVLEPVFRLGIPYLAGQWSFHRKISFRLLAAGAVIYLVFQPIKHDFRSQIWGRTQVGYGERVEAWGFALNTFFSRDDKQEQVQDSAVARVAELDSVIHAFDMLPGQVQQLDGSGWLPILTAPIPRLIWRDKPTTQEGAEQRYAITFRRQTEEGARTTAIMLPLLVDGYWNFGWPGIAFACGMVGLWVGFCQKLWSADHWALQAMGVAHFSRLSVQAHLGAVYSGLFQSLTGLLLACWAVYWLAGLLSRTPAVAARRLVTPAITRGRAPSMSRRSSAR